MNKTIIITKSAQEWLFEYFKNGAYWSSGNQWGALGFDPNTEKSRVIPTTVNQNPDYDFIEVDDLMDGIDENTIYDWDDADSGEEGSDGYDAYKEAFESFIVGGIKQEIEVDDITYDVVTE